MHFGIPEEKKSRVIINTGAKNEVDDQFEIVQAALSESMDFKCISDFPGILKQR